MSCGAPGVNRGTADPETRMENPRGHGEIWVQGAGLGNLQQTEATFRARLVTLAWDFEGPWLRTETSASFSRANCLRVAS